MIRYMTGFEEYHSGQNSSIYLTRGGAHSNFTISDSGRFGGKALTHATLNSGISYQFTNHYSPDFIVGFAYKFDQANKAGRVFCQLYQTLDYTTGAATPEYEIGIYKCANDCLQIYAKHRLDSGFSYFDAFGIHSRPVATTPPLLRGRFYYIELSLTLPSGYAIQNFHQRCQAELRIDGTTVSTAREQDLISQGTYFDFNQRDYTFRIIDGGYGIPAGQVTRGMRFLTDDPFLQQWWDDFYMIDNQAIHGVSYTDQFGNPTDLYSNSPNFGDTDRNTTTFLTGNTYGPTDFLGDQKISYIPVDEMQTGSHNEWKIQGSDQFAAVQGIEPNGDTNYVHSAVANARQTYKFPNIPSSVEQIIAIGVVAEVETSSSVATDFSTRQFTFVAGTPTDGLVLDNDAFQALTGPYITSNPYSQYHRYWHRNPATNSIWTVDSINTFEAGLKGL